MNTKLFFHTVALRGFLLALLGFAFSSTARAADGGLGNRNTAEGTGALFSLTTGLNNTAVGFRALFSNTTGSDNTATGGAALYYNTEGVSNTATGRFAMFANTTGYFNTADGYEALRNNTTGANNTAYGLQTLLHNTFGGFNTAYGTQALFANTGGFGNTAIGFGALSVNSSGSNSIAVGRNAGTNVAAAENDIYIGNPGPGSFSTESNTIRIGTQTAVTDVDFGTHAAHTATFIAGISGVAVTGSTVVVGPKGKLGVAASSARFKEAIKPMDKASETILALRPVTFQYKKEIDPDSTPQFGLVAEEVAKVNPALVSRDADGKAFTVRYEAVNAMLLNEFLKEHRKIEGLEATVAQQKRDFQSALAQQAKDLQACVAQQQDEIKSLAVSLKEQAVQLRNVSYKSEVSESSPRVVTANP